MASSATQAMGMHKTTELGLETATPSEPERKVEGMSIIMFSGELDKVLAGFTLANGAAAMDLPVSMFFTFWGLNVLRRGHAVHTTQKKTTMEGMFGRMMPNGPEDLQLSKLKMAGLGTRLIKREMSKKHVADIQHLLKSAQDQGVHFIACTMSMDLMGIKKDELIPGVSYGNVASFVDIADRSRITLFI